MIQLGILGSTKGTDLKAIHEAINQKVLNAKISVIISNRPNAYILKRADNYNIPNCFISSKNKSRTEFDSEISSKLKLHQVDLVLLIGFMRILSFEFCEEWNNKVLNVHPSLLPKYAGGMDINVHEQVLKNKERETGCTIHLVTKDVDMGPILLQKKCTINNDDTAESLKDRVQKLEGEAFIEVIKSFNLNTKFKAVRKSL